MKESDPYLGNSPKGWEGCALGVIKSNRNSGTSKLQVTSPGLADTKMDFKLIIE